MTEIYIPPSLEHMIRSILRISAVVRYFILLQTSLSGIGSMLAYEGDVEAFIYKRENPFAR